MIVTSSATVSPASVATAQPDLGVCVMITSSGCSVTVSPSTTTGAVAAELIWPASHSGSAAVIAAATAGVVLPKRLPSARKFGFTV